MCVESVTTGLSPVREHVEAVRLHVHALPRAARPGRQMRKMVGQILAHLLLIGRDGIDIDQRARQLENIHNALRDGERCPAKGAARRAEALPEKSLLEKAMPSR